MKNKEEIINEFLNKDINKLDDFALKVNNDKSFFQKTDFEVIEGIPKYFEPNELNRTSGGIAIISKYTLSILVEKHLKYPDPNGWTEKINNSHIFYQCHFLLYLLYELQEYILGAYVEWFHLNALLLIQYIFLQDFCNYIQIYNFL